MNQPVLFIYRKMKEDDKVSRAKNPKYESMSLEELKANMEKSRQELEVAIHNKNLLEQRKKLVERRERSHRLVVQRSGAGRCSEYNEPAAEQLYKETYQYPSRKAMKKMKAEVKRNVNRRSLLVAKEEDLIKNLNPKITGWKNYYSTKRNEKWMKALDWYIICTFTRWYNKKHQRRNHMSKVGFVRNSIYGKGLKKMAGA